MDRELAKLYDQITRTATYDKNTKTYYISKNDYYILGLSNETTRNKIKKICQELGVNLDFQNKLLPDIKGIELFSKYNTIKHILETTTNEEERKILELKRIHLRNLITQYNMELIEAIINRRISNTTFETINKSFEIEELYQIGYEFLLNYIDTHYLEKEKLKYCIDQLLIIRIKRALEEQIGISIHSSKELLQLRGKLLETNQSIEKLSISLNLEESRVKELLNLDSIITPIGYDEIIELYETQNLPETAIVSKEKEENLLRILRTLPTNAQEIVIIKLYGLNGEKIHTYEQLATEFGVSEATINIRRKLALEALTSPLRSKYIKQIMDIELSDEERKLSLKQLSTKDLKNLKQLELFLLKQLDENILISLIENLNSRLKESLLSYLGYIKKSKRYTSQPYMYYTELEYALEYLRNKITELYVIDSKNEEITNYLDYLMYQYLKKPKTKVKTRIK